MEEKDADECILLLKGYYRLFTERELPVHVTSCNSWQPEPGIYTNSKAANLMA